MSKNNIKKTHLFLVTILICIFLLSLSFNLRKLIFRQCVEHVDNGKTHFHTMLKIVQEGREVPIPKNLGIVDGCMHPLHTHDETSLIHMEYPYPVPFFLGDFFDVMGVTFGDNQIGAIKSFDKYKITVKKNGTLVKSGFRWIILKDLDKIEIKIVKEK